RLHCVAKTTWRSSQEPPKRPDEPGPEPSRFGHLSLVSGPGLAVEHGEQQPVRPGRYLLERLAHLRERADQVTVEFQSGLAAGLECVGDRVATRAAAAERLGQDDRVADGQ